MNVAFKDPQTGRSLDALAEALLLPSGIEGVYARTAVFEDVVTRLAAFISGHREPGTEVLRFPPVMSRRQLERSGYLKSFPHFLGCVCCLDGGEAEVRGTVERFEAGEEVSPATLKTRGLVKGQYDVLKILGDGELTKRLKISAHKFSASAKEKIEKAGGQITVLPGKAPVVKAKKEKKKATAAT